MYTDDPAIINNALIPYITGAITFAGIINGINLFFLVMQRFNLSFFVTFLILMLGWRRNCNCCWYDWFANMYNHLFIWMDNGS